MTSASKTTPIWFWVISVSGLLWSFAGTFQYLIDLRSTVDSLKAEGMTADQALIYFSMPGWFWVIYGMGVISGVAGCIMLLLHKKVTVWILFVTAICGTVSFLVDWWYDFFILFGWPMIGLSTAVLLISISLFAVAQWARQISLLS